RIGEAARRYRPPPSGPARRPDSPAGEGAHLGRHFASARPCRDLDRRSAARPRPITSHLAPPALQPPVRDSPCARPAATPRAPPPLLPAHQAPHGPACE